MNKEKKIKPFYIIGAGTLCLMIAVGIYLSPNYEQRKFSFFIGKPVNEFRVLEQAPLNGRFILSVSQQLPSEKDYQRLITECKKHAKAKGYDAAYITQGNDKKLYFINFQ